MIEGAIARNQIRARLAATRAEILLILEPPRRSEGGGEPGTAAGGLGGGFPRSRTMKLLLSGRGVGTVGAVIGGLLMARPALAWRLLRMIPTSAAARMLLLKAITEFRSRRRAGP
ncbi:MAG: hypothetical protein M3O41_09180 [Pseudomonadota bacterium]|nr:hypothetical protein [Pseudomonadota bacterium]